jgi:hypothetical protein
MIVTSERKRHVRYFDDISRPLLHLDGKVTTTYAILGTYAPAER